jgi:lactate dehydrogenase-like 2-hydroxyacid dehydrogenase
MRPIVILTRDVFPETVQLLSSLCDLATFTTPDACERPDFTLYAQHACALVLIAPQPIDDGLLRRCARLKIVACAFRVPTDIDIAACTRRGIWVTDVLTHDLGCNAQLEAARNVLDVLSGDNPRSALNQVRTTKDMWSTFQRPRRRTAPLLDSAQVQH